MRISSLLAAVVAMTLTWCGAFCGEPQAEEKTKAAIAELRAKLEKPIAVDMVDMNAGRALELLAKRADVNFLMVGRLDRPAYLARVSMTLDGARAIDILDLLCDTTALHYDIRPGVVQIRSVLDMAERKVTFCAYSVQDLTTILPDFPPPFGAFYSSFQGETASGGAFVPAPRVAPTLTNIADMIRNRVRPESWDPALGTSIEERGHVLIVMQTEEVHALIRKLLAGFRSRQSRQVGVDVRAFAIKSTDVDRIRREVTARNAAAPIFDDASVAAVEKLAQSGAAELVFNGASIVYNTQLGLIDNLKSQHLLSSYEISGDDFDPVVRTILTGTVVSFMPILSDDASLVSVTLRMAHTELIGSPENFVIQRGGLRAGPTTGGNVVTIKRRHKEEPKKEGEKKEGEKKEGEKNETADDITSEFEISSTNTGGAFPSVGPLQLQLPTLGRSRISQEMMLPAGKYAAISAPLSGKDGLVLGRELLVLLRCRPLTAPEPAAEPEKKDIAEMPEALKQALEKRTSVAFLETPFQRAIEAFSAQTKVPMALDWEGLEKRLKAPVTLDLKDAKADEILGLILRAGDAALMPYNSLLWVTSRVKVSSKRMTLRVFDIRDITRGLVDFPGEIVWGIPAGAAAAGAFADPLAQAGDMTVGLAAGDFAAILKDKLLAEQFNNPATSIEESGGKLVVINTPEVLAKVAQVLGELRKTARRPLLVTTRWAVVNTEALKTALGQSLPQSLNAQEADKALDLIAAEGSRDLASVRLICFNGQRSSGFGGIERTFVKDYDVSGSVMDPVVSSLIAGAVADVKPLILEGTGGADVPNQLMIETRLSFSRTDANPTAIDPVASAKEGPLTMPPLPGKIQTPASSSQDIRSTVRIQDGGAALFRLPVPDWIQGEDAAAAKKGERTLIVLLHAQQQKE